MINQWFHKCSHPLGCAKRPSYLGVVVKASPKTHPTVGYGTSRYDSYNDGPYTAVSSPALTMLSWS